MDRATLGSPTASYFFLLGGPVRTMSPLVHIGKDVAVYDSVVSDATIFVMMLIVSAIAIWGVWMYHATRAQYELLAEQWDRLVDDYYEIVDDRNYWHIAYKSTKDLGSNQKDSGEVEDPWL